MCGEADRFRGKKISIAPLQISNDLPSVEKAKLSGFCHHRKDIAESFREEPCGNIHYTRLFEEAYNLVAEIPEDEMGSTLQAKTKLKLRHGNLVIIVGPPGIGKSTLTKKLVKEMWECSLFNPEIAFFIRFSEINYEEKTDFLQFLAPHTTHDLTAQDKKQILTKLKKNCNIYIVMDGLDEANLKFNQASSCNLDSKSTAEVFIQNLLLGNILPESKKIITSRTYQIAKMPIDIRPKFLFNMKGFDEAALKDICKNVCGKDTVNSERILDHLKHHPDLKNYCHTPLICIMVMESLYNTYALKGNDSDPPNNVGSFESKNVRTLTAIFVFALKKWLVEKIKRTGKFQSKQISEVAFAGMKNDQFFFREFDLKRAKVNFETSNAFLNTFLKGKKKMYFIHLMWQEFFAAVNLRLYTSKKNFISMLDSLNSEKYEVVTRFLFGLCNDDTLDELLDLVNAEEVDTEVSRKEFKALLKQMVIKKVQALPDTEMKSCKSPVGNSYGNSILPTLARIFEMGDIRFAKQIAGCLKCEIIFDGEILPSDILNINRILRLRNSSSGLVLKVMNPIFVGNCHYSFYKELHTTLNQKPNIQVSSRK